MSHAVTRAAEHPQTADQLKNQRIGKWITKLASYLQHSREFRECDELTKARFWAELVQVMAEADIPETAWSTDAIRYCRRRFTFFPCAAELCETLHEYAAPIRAAELEEWKKQQTKRAVAASDDTNLSPLDGSWLAYFRRHAENDFQDLAIERGTNRAEARHAALSLLRQQSYAAFCTLSEYERRDEYRPECQKGAL